MARQNCLLLSALVILISNINKVVYVLVSGGDGNIQ